MDTNISPIELALQKKLDKLQPKTKTPGFLRSVIERQSVRIDAALAMGYSYDEVASIFAEQGIKCKGSTLRKIFEKLLLVLLMLKSYRFLLLDEEQKR